MKKFAIAFTALALFSTAAFAGKEICFTRHVVANYVGGTGDFTTCYQNDRGVRQELDECEVKH